MTSHCSPIAALWAMYLPSTSSTGSWPKGIAAFRSPLARHSSKVRRLSCRKKKPGVSVCREQSDLEAAVRYGNGAAPKCTSYCWSTTAFACCSKSSAQRECEQVGGGVIHVDTAASGPVQSAGAGDAPYLEIHARDTEHQTSHLCTAWQGEVDDLGSHGDADLLSLHRCCRCTWLPRCQTSGLLQAESVSKR